MLNSVAQQWGAFRYDDSKDVARVDVAPKDASATEELTFDIEGNEIVLRWGDKAGAVGIK